MIESLRDRDQTLPGTADDVSMTTQTAGVADHAATDDTRATSGGTAIAAAHYASTVLPGVLYLLGTYVFDGGEVPGPLQGLVGVAVTGACTALVGYLRQRG